MTSDAELVEAVARAIWHTPQDPTAQGNSYALKMHMSWDEAQRAARAAIAAMPPSISRDTEVTEAMVERGVAAVCGMDHTVGKDKAKNVDWDILRADLRAIYLAMSAEAPRPMMEGKVTK